MSEVIQKDSFKLAARMFYIQIASVVILQVGESPLWLTTIYLLSILWAYLYNRRIAPLPSNGNIWIVSLSLGFLLALSSSFKPSATLLSNIFTLWVVSDVLRKVNYERIHWSGLKILSLMSLEFILSKSTWFSIVYVIFTVAIIINLLISNNGLGGDRSFHQRLTDILKVSVQTAPLIIALFVMIPNLLDVTPKVFQSNRAITGIGSHLDPGRIAQLSQNNRRSFSVEVKKGRLPQTRDRYWRGKVMTHSKGLEWRVANRRERIASKVRAPFSRIRVIKESNSGDGIFSISPILRLDFRSIQAKLTRFDDETASHSILANDKPIEYHVDYANTSQFEALDPVHDFHLQVPKTLSSSVLKLVNDIGRTSQDQKDFTRNLMSWYKKEGFVYTLSPGALSPPTIENFFKSKKGFCGHFAASFATLLRVYDIPTRVVVGFHGGQFNQLTEKFTISGHDAHAWVEARFNGDAGWTLIDPTELIAPERLQWGGQRYHGALSENIIRLLPPDWVEYLWQSSHFATTVLEFIQDEWRAFQEAYEVWFDKSIFSGLDHRYFIIIVMLTLFLFLRSSRTRNNKNDRIFTLYVKKVGIPRLSHETEKEYVYRVSKNMDRKELHERFLNLFLEHKYGKNRQLRRDMKNILKEIN